MVIFSWQYLKWHFHSVREDIERDAPQEDIEREEAAEAEAEVPCKS